MTFVCFLERSVFYINDQTRTFEMMELHAAGGGITGQNTAMVLRSTEKSTPRPRQRARSTFFGLLLLSTASIQSSTVESWGWLHPGIHEI
jgi:hypothetical protein